VIRSYLPAIIFLLLGAIVGVTFAGLNTAFGPRRRIPAKTQPYECGLPSEVKQGFRFGISFYLIGMLFILFDTEVFFFAPIAIHLRAYGLYALGETITFVVLLMVALLYVWRRGALEWR
jgi:NADH-quinone oxidoreductase subunit A